MMMVCGYKKLFFPRENHVSLPCLVEAILVPRIGGFDVCSMLQKRKLPLRLYVALT